MKVIFLDIDWVLIRFWNTAQIRNTRARKQDMWKLITSLDADLVENLRCVISQTGAVIVVSSSWRRVLWDVLREELTKYDMWKYVIWKTPDSLWHGRGNEILTWLDEHHRSCSIWEHVSDWVVIDDDSFDMKAVSRLGKLVKTQTHIWLDAEKTQNAIDILNSKTPVWIFQEVQQ